MQRGLLTAIQVPVCVAKIVNSLWPSLTELAHVGNINCKSDLQVSPLVISLLLLQAVLLKGHKSKQWYDHNVTKSTCMIY